MNCKIRRSSQAALFICVSVIVLPILAAAGSRWDVEPTPLMIMEDAGIATTVEAVSQTLSDTSQDEQLRYWAAMALGQLADEQAVPVLRKSLSDRSAVVRAGSASALGFIGSIAAIEPLCETALHDDNMVPRRNAVTSLYFLVTDDSTKCLVQVAGNETELRELRLASLSLLSQQLQERRGFEGLIPTLNDPDAEIKGMSAVILSIEYADEPAVLESLSVTRSLVDATLSVSIHSSVYVRMVERLEDVAAREFFLDGEDSNFYYEPIHAAVNDRIRHWAADSL